MDTSSELIHSLLPVFLVAGLGASPLALGLIEGAAEGVASVMRVFSGALSDRSGRRKPLILCGYALAALSKPLFPLAGSAATVFAARATDRLGKGIRGAPRDALVADVTPQASRGAAYGLRQALDTVGAVLGPALAIALMYLLANDVRAVFWVATVPALLAVAVLVVFVREPAAPRPRAALQRFTFAWLRPGTVPPGCRAVIALAALLAFARVAEAFVLLRASELGLAAALVPLVLIVMNVAYALSAWPAGAYSDRFGRKPVLACGLGLLLLADLLLARAADPWTALLGAMVWGLHLGATQGLLAALLADRAPADARGAAFGWLHLGTGLATVLAGALGGWLWTRFGAGAAYAAGAVCAALALALLGVLPGRDAALAPR
nr:MFS transporter [Pseudomonadales bacterium]